MKANVHRGAALLVAALLIALPAWAADDPHAAAGEAHESPALFSVDPGLMIWTIVTFALVLLILSRTAWKPMIQALQEREQRISGAIEDADRIKTEAEELFARHETMMDKAKDEARGILDEARRDGVAVQEEIRRKALEEAQEFKDRARREIELAKDGAIKELWDEAANLSTELASRILGRALNQDDQDRLVRELIQEMRKEGNGAASGTGRGTENA